MLIRLSSKNDIVLHEDSVDDIDVWHLTHVDLGVLKDIIDVNFESSCSQQSVLDLSSDEPCSNDPHPLVFLDFVIELGKWLVQHPKNLFSEEDEQDKAHLDEGCYFSQHLICRSCWIISTSHYDFRVCSFNILLELQVVALVRS